MPPVTKTVIKKPIPKEESWLDKLDNVLSAPQRAATYAVEAGLHKIGIRKDPPKYENPSDGLGISEKDHPWIKMGTDMLLDPTNLLGVGLASKASKIAKGAKILKKSDNIIGTLDNGNKVIGTINKTKNYKGASKAADWQKNVNNVITFPSGQKVFTNMDDITYFNKFNEAVEIGAKESIGSVAIINDLINQQNNTQQTNQSTTKSNVVPKQTFNKIIKEIPKTNFEQRIQNPVKQINNPDGTHSTHKMMSFEADGKYYAAPTIVQQGDSLVELSQKDAIQHAFKNKELKEFKTEKESQDYANGGYKVNTPLDPKLKDSTKEVGKPERYWLGTSWGSYDELIKSNPQLSNPNIFYNTFHKRAPNDSTGTKTNMIIPKYKLGGEVEPEIIYSNRDNTSTKVTPPINYTKDKSFKFTKGQDMFTDVFVGAIPVIGDGVDAYQAIKGIKENDPYKTIINGFGATLPFISGQTLESGSELLQEKYKEYLNNKPIKKYKQGGEIKNSWLDTYGDGGDIVENQTQPQPLDSTTYENNIKNNYTSFLKNNPSVTLPKTVQNGDGMNCINGVCNLINASSGLELKSGQYATKVGKGKSYVGNASFNDASEKEGFYKLTNDDLNRDGFKPGDVVQYSKYKLNANRFDGKVNSNNAFDLYPQHAKIIVDKYKKGADTYYKIVDNGGEESYRINEISEKDLMNHNKNGYNAGLGHNYAGLIVQRYNPNEVINRQNIEKSKKDIIKGINPHSKEYDTVTLPNYKFNENSDNQGGKLGNELMSIYNKNYKQIGKSSNLSPDILNKLMLNQVGIAGQETKYGSDLGFVKNLIPDFMLDEARQIKRNFNNEDSWTKDYYQKHSNKPEFVKKYPSLSKFQNEISNKYGDTSGKDNYLYLHGARSKGVFQQKELSERGNYLVKDKNLSNLESQAVGSLTLAVDNYHKLAAKYPNLKSDQLIDLVTLSHNAPGKAMIPEYVEYYLKNNDIDYVNKVKKLIPAIENNSSKQKINTSNNLLSNR